MMWLKSLSTCPPNEFTYEQNGRRFPGTPLIGQLARDIIEFRKGNSLPRASHNEAIEDIVLFTCRRLNNDPQWCADMPFSLGELLPQASGGSCSGCGASVS